MITIGHAYGVSDFVPLIIVHMASGNYIYYSFATRGHMSPIAVSPAGTVREASYSHYDVFFIMTSFAPRPALQTYEQTDTLPRLIYTDDIFVVVLYHDKKLQIRRVSENVPPLVCYNF